MIALEAAGADRYSSVAGHDHESVTSGCPVQSGNVGCVSKVLKNPQAAVAAIVVSNRVGSPSLHVKSEM